MWSKKGRNKSSGTPESHQRPNDGRKKSSRFLESTERPRCEDKKSPGIPGSTKRKNSGKTKEDAVPMLLSLLLWCLPCADACSATRVLDTSSYNHTSPTGSPANGPLGAVPCCGGSFIDGVIYGLMPPNGSLNPPKVDWVLILLISVFSSIRLGGLQQYLQRKYQRAVKRKTAKTRTR